MRNGFWRALLASPGAVAGVTICAAVLVGAGGAGLLAPQNPYDLASLQLADARLAPGTIGSGGYVHWLGTDDQGRDLLSAILYGIRISLFVALGAGLLAVSIGTSLGLLAAMRGGWFDSVLMRLVDFQLSFPAILLALVLLASLGQGIGKIIVALVAVQWAIFARTMRAAALVEREKDYIAAVRSLGLGIGRTMLVHLLPNCLPPLIVVATVQIANAVALEATLSFLGLGMPLTQPSLGLLIANGFQHILAGEYWISMFPGAALLLIIVGINLIGERVRVVLNPRTAR